MHYLYLHCIHIQYKLTASLTFLKIVLADFSELGGSVWHKGGWLHCVCIGSRVHPRREATSCLCTGVGCANTLIGNDVKYNAHVFLVKHFQLCTNLCSLYGK